MPSRQRLARTRVAAVVVSVTLLGTVGPGFARALDHLGGLNDQSGPDSARLAAGTATGDPSATPSPTPTPIPTSTPSPTLTSTPSAVPTPTPTPAPPGTPAAASVVVPLPPPSSRWCRSGLVALTFDDGPDPRTTARLVKVLTDAHVPATFFMVGARVKQHPELARLVQRNGFGVGNHTYRHADLAHLSARGIRSQLAATAVQLRAAGVRPGPLMRPPYGATNHTVTGVARSMGLTPTLWSIDSRDWSRGSPPQIAHRVVSRLEAHRPNVVLQHDGVVRSPLSLAAVPAIIGAARLKGYCFTSLNASGRPTVPVPTVTARATDGGGADGRAVELRVSLSQPTSRPVAVRVTTTGGTAVPGVGVAAVNRVVTLSVGATTALVRLPVARSTPSLGTGDATVDLRVTAYGGVRMAPTTVTAVVRRALPGALPTLAQ